MRPFWDEKLSVLSSDAPTNERAAVANELERHIASVEKQRDDHFAEIVRARGIIEGLTLYREKLVCFIPDTTAPQRDRMRELATQDCDYDRSVLELLADFDRLLGLCSQPTLSAQETASEVSDRVDD